MSVTRSAVMSAPSAGSKSVSAQPPVEPPPMKNVRSTRVSLPAASRAVAISE
jgi:hypothetical protein